MKRILVLILALLSAFAFVACDGENVPPNDPVEGYVFQTQGVTIQIAAETAPILASLGKELAYDDSNSCYFTGKDKIYTYAGFEIHTYPTESGDRVNRVVLLDDTVETKEGIRIGSSQADVITAYGEATKKSNDSWDYDMGNVMCLRIFFKNGTVDMIHYLHPQAK